MILRTRASTVMDLMWKGRESRSQHQDPEEAKSKVPFTGWVPVLPFMASSSLMLTAAEWGQVYKILS